MLSSLIAAPSLIAGPRGAASVVRSQRSVRMAEALTQDELKKMVGYKAVDDYVKSGMVVGLGTGSTAAFAVERVGMLLKSGELKDIVAIPTSVRTKEQAEELGIPLTTLGTPESRFSKLDVAIDGADAVDPALNLIKGGGGALFREKIVEECAEKFIVIVDDSKIVDGLGPSFALPVEIAPFCWEHTMRAISELPSLAGGKPQLTRTLSLITLTLALITLTLTRALPLTLTLTLTRSLTLTPTPTPTLTLTLTLA